MVASAMKSDQRLNIWLLIKTAPLGTASWRVSWWLWLNVHTKGRPSARCGADFFIGSCAHKAAEVNVG